MSGHIHIHTHIHTYTHTHTHTHIHTHRTTTVTLAAHARRGLIIAGEASFLVCSMARIFYIIIIFQAIRRAVNDLNVSMCI